jgi:hypothetical protein
MLDLHHHTHAAERLRRWARQGTWRRMVQASAPRPAMAAPSLLARIEHQLQCLSKAMTASNPSR